MLLTRGCSILFQIVLLVLPCLIIKSPQTALAASSTTVDSEFSPRGPNSEEDEFAESYDISSAPMSIGDWLLKSSNGFTDTRARSSMVSLAPVQEPTALECGEFRMSVKNGSDEDAHLVDLSQPIPTTVSTMGELPAPTFFPGNNRIAPIETTVWVVNATLTEYKRAGDQDYHLNLRDASGNAMIVEIPCPCCVDARSPFTSLIAAARSTFDSVLTPTNTLQPVNIPVRVAGVAMFDFPHSQIGAAHNYIELHPVLAISFNVDLNAPLIVSAVINGKKLIVSGFNFDDGTVVLMDGEKQKTRNDEETPVTRLIAKKAGKFISPGQTVTLQVRKSDGTLSVGFSFTRPSH